MIENCIEWYFNEKETPYKYTTQDYEQINPCITFSEEKKQSVIKRLSRYYADRQRSVKEFLSTVINIKSSTTESNAHSEVCR